LLYDDGNSLITLNSSESSSSLNALTDAFNTAAKFVHENNGISPEDLKQKAPHELLNEINKSLSKAITDGLTSNGIKYEVPEIVTNALRENVWRFSGFKTYHQLKEAAQMLVAETGEVKSFAQFRQDIEKINNTYNGRYLEAEYEFAVHSAQMAARWNDFEQDGDDYNLQYRTAGDDKVREITPRSTAPRCRWLIRFGTPTCRRLIGGVAVPSYRCEKKNTPKATPPKRRNWAKPPLPALRPTAQTN